MKQSFLKQHSLSIIIGGIFLLMLIASVFLAPVMKQPDKYPTYIVWIAETDYSLMADVFGAFLLVVLTKYLREKGSAESK